MLKLYVTNGKVFVWNPAVVLELRKEHRIVGSLVGCLFRQSFQNTESGLPLLLMPEEVTLLVEKGIAQLFSNSRIGKLPEPEEVNSFSQHREELLTQQESSRNVSKRDMLLVQQFTECPWKKNGEDEAYTWNYPISEQEKIRCTVFKDLWLRGYFLTSGAKFGGDFLAYAGDPEVYHALFIVVCVPQNLDMKALDLVVLGRMGNQVKKTTVLASVGPAGGAEYISLSWDSELV